MTRWREPDGTIHADNPIENDRTLCGIAEEGDGESAEQELKEVDRRRITCQTCASIIAHCKRIPARDIRRR